jgi:hypothetical protein
MLRRTGTLKVDQVRRNDYCFISERALDACSTYEVQSVSLVRSREHLLVSAGEKEEQGCDGRDVQVVDMPHYNPVIAGGVLGDDLALEGGERVSEQRHTGVSALPARVCESVAACRRGVSCQRLVLSP